MATYRILIDENTSPDVVDALRDRGYEAKHVVEALDAGVSDDRIVAYAREHDFAVLTHDDDFLSAEFGESVPVLFYADDSLDTAEIADRVDRVAQYVPDPGDLPPVTYLGSWE